MTLRRRAVVYALAALFIAGSGYDIVTDVEHWPFSQYPMFSYVADSRRFESMRFYGASAAEARLTEFPLRAYAYLQPLDQCRTATALSWMRHEPDGHARLQDAVQKVYERYEMLRKEGRHDGPPLASVRLYSVAWDLDPWARNVEAPDTRRLAAEYTPDTQVTP